MKGADVSLSAASKFQAKILHKYACRVLTYLIFLLGFTGRVNADDIPGISSPDVFLGEELTLERCIQVALASRPSLEETRSGIESQASRVSQAAASARPQVRISPSYGYSRNESTGQGGSFTTDFSLSQTILDWNRTDLSILGAQQEYGAKLLDGADSEQAVIAEVSNAYYSLNRSSRNLNVASERVDNYERRSKWAKDFYEAGAKARIEITKAETDLANARLDMVQARGEVSKAVSNLAHAMGAPDWISGDIADLLDTPEIFQPESEDITADEAIKTAVANRLDIKAQDIRVEAGRTNLALAERGMSPTLTGSAGYSFSGETDPTAERNWRLSVGLVIPVLDGGLTREQIKQAKSDLSSAEARRESLRQSVILSVRTAHASLLEARESVKAAAEVEKQARETLNLAQGRYKAGVGNSLEISDAVDGYAQARIRVVTALYNLKSAEIDLKRVMGVVSK
jgi:outer membrane protein TolC